ncbi:hypothetical protein AMJ52_02790 [candidate division TA06 bacterium DG_78]|uniref:Secretion system C-terminal sorting domain-containing protein n=1 Tax=candidate division TA06 bacterium DG_78 TaxID=1703772 RepID=A0A0S7YGS9_UNCT6|nr:MAG: hypothetical protein AMJ52_02790 [candidate division TA06 bacterium DG_78]
MKFRGVVIGCFVFLLGSFLWAETFNVNNPTEFQNALNTAASNSENDTINVSADTYNITTTLTFTSTEDFSLFIDGAGTGSTILDGGNSTQIFQFSATAANADLELQDMTFQNGNADHGGAIHLETVSASMSMSNCDFDDNTAGYVGGGANIYSNTGEITITYCTFRRNSSPNPSGYPYGTAGGLFVQTEGAGTDLRVAHCTFEDNTAQRDAAGAMLYPLGSGASMIVENNTFNNNSAVEFGGGCFIRMPAGNSTVTYENNTLTGNSTTGAGNGGGSYFEIASGTLTLSDNIHTNNTSAWNAGGVWVELGSGVLEITDNTFTDNEAVENGGGVSIFLDEGTMLFHRNVLSSNTSDGVGGGFSAATTSGALTVSNNTFYSDSASEAGGIYFYFDQSSAEADVFNNILWHDTSPAIAFSGAASVTATYCDIEGGTGEPWFGAGCIDTDPLFIDPENGNLYLSWANWPIEDGTKSPCIDTGDPASPQDPDNTRADMGFHYFNQITGINENRPNVTSTGLILQNFPNPFGSNTTICYSVYKPYNVKIQIYNILGELVETLVNDYKTTGNYEVIWNTEDLNSGLYICRLIGDSNSATKKLILTR